MGPDHKRPARLRQKPPAKAASRKRREVWIQPPLYSELQYQCGFCGYIYVSDDYPSERRCPVCGRSEV